MKKIFLMSAVLIIFFLSGCIPSLHPLYTEDTLVSNDQLLGDWINEEDDNETWLFAKMKNKYALIHRDEDGLVGGFEVGMVKLGGSYFLDFYLDDDVLDEKILFGDKAVPEGSESMSDLKQMHLLLVHTFAKVAFQEDKVVISFLGSEWLIDLFEEQKIRINFESRDNEGDLILTASTEDLQKFLIKYGDEEKAFNDPIILRRRNTDG